MFFIVLIVLFIVLKYFDISFFAGLSWWWLGLLMAIAFIWFEFIEKALGLDKKRAHETLEKAREERVRKTFEKDKGKKR
ncbi:MAG: TIGR04438 family Trp-rich protein [Oxalobacter sp.]|nr:MAG: TIGR04438 family Trp-rich protein [Oxalobacter sp.]